MPSTVADTSLTPSEREDRETDRRVRRQDRAPSRRRTEKRAPRDDLRKKRVQPDDPDWKPIRRRRRTDDRDDDRRVSARPWIEEKTLNRFERSVDQFYDDVDETAEVDWDDLVKQLDLSHARLRKIEKENKKGTSWLSRMVKKVTDLFRKNRWKSVEEAMDAPDTVRDPEVREFVEELDEEAPKTRRSGGRGVAASNEALTAMVTRLAKYHGVLDQRGNPTDPPNTGWKSIDQRYIGEEHYKRILKCASDLLEEDWLQYGWEGGAKDAPVRAALDLAIQTCDGAAYQSKIDGDTYNLLLNRLAGWGHDTFSETVLPMKASESGEKRSASAMPKSQEYTNIVKVANDLRTSNPLAALMLLRNLRALTANEAPAMAAPPVEAAAADMGEFSFKSMSDEDFAKLKDDAKKEMDALFNEADVEAFLEGLEKMIEGVQKKTASIGGSALIPVALLMKVAAASTEAKQAFGLTILAAAKRKKPAKKDDKAAGKKKSDKPNPFADKGKKDEGDKPKKGDKPDFGGKKAPPFPPKKGKKRAASIEADDATW